MKFFKHLFTVVLGTFIAMGITFFTFIVASVAIVAGINEAVEVESIDDNTILKLNINSVKKEYHRSWNENIELGFEKNIGLSDALEAIKHAKHNPKIVGISIPQTYSQMGFAQLSNLRRAVEDFKQSGKFVYAYGEILPKRDYYLKSVADSIFISPMGIVELNGLSSERLFFKSFQEQTGVKMEVIRHGKYKSAVEPFLRNDMSEENKEQISELLTSVWKAISTEISNSRDISLERLNNITDKFDSRFPELALKHKLIDGIFYMDEYEDFLKNKIGMNESESAKFIGLSKYISLIKEQDFMNEKSENKIAVIYAEGEIKKTIDGIDNDNISYQKMKKALRSAAKNEKVKAIVLRINSPGGDAMESDMIWREVEKAKKSKKVYVSMGNYAASGGYYIACGADKILAENTTITGSIGVFAILPNVKGLTDKIGVYAESVKTHKNASFYSIYKPLSNSSKGFITEGIENIYTRFIEKVAQGRSLKRVYIDSIAQGRVWTGEQAKKIGLVDDIGGIEKTIELAAEGEGLTEYSIIRYPKKELNFQSIISELSNNIAVKTPYSNSVVFKSLLDKLEMADRFLEEKTIYYTRLPYVLDIK